MTAWSGNDAAEIQLQLAFEPSSTSKPLLAARRRSRGGWLAGCKQRRGNIWHARNIRMSASPCRSAARRVDPRQLDSGTSSGFNVFHVARLADREPGIYLPGTIAIDVRQRVRLAIAPCQPLRWQDHDGTIDRFTENMSARLERAIGLQRFHRYRHGFHGQGFAIHHIAFGIARIEHQHEQGEPFGAGDRVRPTDIFIEADADHRQRRNGRAHPRRSRRELSVHLVEAIVTLPREMGVAEQQTRPFEVVSRPKAQPLLPYWEISSSISDACASPILVTDRPGGAATTSAWLSCYR